MAQSLLNPLDTSTKHVYEVCLNYSTKCRLQSRFFMPCCPNTPAYILSLDTNTESSCGEEKEREMKKSTQGGFSM